MMKRDLLFKEKALAWASSFDVCCVLDSNGYTDRYQKFDLMIATGSRHQLSISAGKAFDQLKIFYETHRDWIFGFLGYDLKNELEALTSENQDELAFPDLFFFVPENLVLVRKGEAEVLRGHPGLLKEIMETAPHHASLSPDPEIECRISKETYLKKIEELQEHIRLGDVYEVTFCQEFFARHAGIDPLSVYQKLGRLSPTPFAGFFKTGDRYILSASPERFLCKRGSKLVSQPIKGTAKRHPEPETDLRIREQLKGDLKEQTENVMIVDLVRNDLTKSAAPGSVRVEELFGVYTFPQVHQMISTISCELGPDLHFTDALKNAFPMGSMTGAPKVRAMELIEQLECSKRGAYSGAIGYIDPEGDFDFNVVIRSILYHAGSKYLSFQVGGAITYNSVPEKEFEECMLKASAMVETLKG